jgi:hypothetical protein
VRNRRNGVAIAGGQAAGENSYGGNAKADLSLFEN